MPLRTPCVYYDPEFLPDAEATEAYDELLKNTPWEKTPKINRWVTLMELPREGGSGEGAASGGDGASYKYRDAPGASIVGFPPVVQKMKLLAEQWYNSRRGGDAPDVEFNVCLLNVSWYSYCNFRFAEQCCLETPSVQRSTCAHHLYSLTPRCAYCISIKCRLFRTVLPRRHAAHWMAF